MRPVAASSRRTVLTIAALVGLASGLHASGADPAAETLLHRVLAQTTRSGNALRAIRHLEAGALSGKHHGWMDVETTLTPGGAFSYRVLDAGGSDRTREKVFLAILDAEREAWRNRADDVALLSPANYQFTVDESGQSGSARIRLVPRRSDARLVSGVLTVSQDGSPLMLEGRLAKCPSFWVKSVTIMKRYERVAGVALPILIESLADVRLMGEATFSMRYRYTEVNGRSVLHSAASAPNNNFGPSAELLSLHALLGAGE